MSSDTTRLERTIERLENELAGRPQALAARKRGPDAE